MKYRQADKRIGAARPAVTRKMVNLLKRAFKPVRSKTQKERLIKKIGYVGELIPDDVELGEPGQVIWLDECEALGPQPHWMRKAMHDQRMRYEAGAGDACDDGRYCRPDCKNCGYTPRPEDAGYREEDFIDGERFYPKG